MQFILHTSTPYKTWTCGGHSRRDTWDIELLSLYTKLTYLPDFCIKYKLPGAFFWLLCNCSHQEVQAGILLPMNHQQGPTVSSSNNIFMI